MRRANSVEVDDRPIAKQADCGEILSSRTFFVAAAILAACIFAVYLPCLDFQFILDDHRFTSDPRINAPGYLWDYFSNYVWAQYTGGPPSFYRPLFILWLRVNFIFSEMSPWGWHLFSVLKHMAVAVLLGLLVWKLLRDRVASLLAAGLFALHPAQAESVAWVTVPDPLMSIAALGAVIFYLQYMLPDRAGCDAAVGKKRSAKGHATAAKPSSGWLVASAIACFAALLAKETAVVVPVILLLLAVLTPVDASATEDCGVKDRVIGALRVAAPLAVVMLAYLGMRLHALGGRLAPDTQPMSWETLLLSWPATLWFYVKVLFWPVQLRAFADPTVVDAFSIDSVLLPGLGVICALAALIALVGWSWSRAAHQLANGEKARVRFALSLGTLLLCVPLLPALNLRVLNPGDFLHGRYTYLPLAGLALLLATAWRMAGHWRLHLLAPVALVALIFTGLTARQEGVWKDEATLFTAAHQLAPRNRLVAMNLVRTRVQQAFALADSGNCRMALPVFEDAARQSPEEWFAWAGMGMCLAQQDDLRGAERAFRRAADLSHRPEVLQQWEQIQARLQALDSIPAD